VRTGPSCQEYVLLNAVSGAVRGIARNRSEGPDRPVIAPARTTTARHVHRRAIGIARFLAHVFTPTQRSHERAAAHGVAVSAPRPRTSARRRLYRRHLALRLTSNRTLPIAVGLIVVLAAGVSLAPGAASVGAAQAADNGNVRIAIGGGAPAGAAGVAALGGIDGAIGDSIQGEDAAGYVDDGTLYKPVAVDTSVKTSAGMLQHYKVRDGDTLTGIASRYGVSMMTLWWANNITSKDALKVGQDLIIPPVSGLVVTVKAGDTLEGLAAANRISAEDIIDANGLEDTNLIAGQVLLLPGAKGDPIPTPKPTKRPTYSSGGGAGVAPTYSGGTWAWPVIGGGNYISQYFHYGHYGVDIAADYGSTVVAALAGTVVYAGWASTGCGYTVIIQHSSTLFTMYCHNSKVLVYKGQHVSRRQSIARIGSTGWATGPHLHFSVSKGYPHEAGSYFVNPLRFY
jgi:murein DD-endopeptidase MepM/ murein hydrolase activator NlpD